MTHRRAWKYCATACQSAAQAVEKAGSTDLEKVTKALHAGNFTSVLGDLSFNEKGDIKQPAYVWYEWNKGKYAEK